MADERGSEELPVNCGETVLFGGGRGGEGGERYWTCSLEQVPVFQFLESDRISDPSVCFFTLLPIDSDLGAPLTPLTKIVLQHTLTSRYIALVENEAEFEATLIDTPDCHFRVTVSGDKSDIRNLDAINLTTETEKGQFSLNFTFAFTPQPQDSFQIHRFSSLPPTTPQLSYLTPFKLLTENMCLSVQPKFENSGRIAIREEDQVEAFWASEESQCFPEYDGELVADLTNNAFDWNGCWCAERGERFKGGEVYSGDSIFLRHLASGRFLASDFKLVTRAKATPWVLSLPDHPGVPLPYSSPVLLTSESIPAISIDRTPTLPTLKSLLFLPHCDPHTHRFRLSLSPKATDLPASRVQFTIEAIPPKDASLALRLSQYQKPLSKLRSLLQNVMKIPRVDDELTDFNKKNDLGQLMMGYKHRRKVGEIVGDFQIGSELVRIWALMKITKGLFGFELKEMMCFKAVGEGVAELQVCQNVCSSLFSQRDLLTPILSISPFALSKVLLPSLTHPLPHPCDHLFWVSLFTSITHELTSYDHYIALSRFLYHLLATLPYNISLNRIGILTLGEEFVLKMSKVEGNSAVWSFGVTRTISEVGEKLSTFVGEMLRLAAVTCVHSEFTEQIIVGMGLDLDFLIEAFADCQDKPRIQIGILTFLALVHIPAVSHNDYPLRRLEEGTLINETAFLESALAQEHHSDVYSFTTPGSELVNLVKFEVNFWLCELLSQVKGESGLWYQTLTAHLLFLTKLVTYRCVSDAFVAITVECVTAVLKDFVISATEDGEFLSCEKGGLDKMTFLGQFWDYIETIQLWKLFRITQELIVNEEFTIGKTRIGELSAELESAAILKKYLAAAPAGEDSTVLQAMKILINNPENDTESLLTCLITAVPIPCERRSKQVERVMYRQGNFSEWVEKYLLAVGEESLSLPFLVMIRGIQSFGSVEIGKSEGNEPGLAEMVSTLESLYDVLSSLTAGNLFNFQEILQKAGFLSTLSKLWIRADFVEGVEVPTYVEYISLVLDVTRLYCSGHEANKAEILAILPEHVCFLDYPQYIRLLLDLGVIKQELVSGIVLLLIEFAQVTNFKRPILALESLMTDKALLPLTLIVVSTYFSTVEKPCLSPIDWEIMLIAVLSTPVSFRASLFEAGLMKWYGKEERQIRREGAAIMVYAGETTNELFHAGLVETVSHIEQALGAEHIAEAHFKLCSYARIQRARNSELGGSDLVYVLELLWHKTSGIIAQIPAWMERISLQDVMMQLARVYICLPGVEAMKEQIGMLGATLRLYILKTDDPLEEDDRDLLLTVCLKEIGPFEPDEPSVLHIKPPSSLFSSSPPSP